MGSDVKPGYGHGQEDTDSMEEFADGDTGEDTSNFSFETFLLRRYRATFISKLFFQEDTQNFSLNRVQSKQIWIVITYPG